MTRIIHKVYSFLSYNIIAYRLKLQSLDYKSLIADLLWYYKIVFNVVDISIDGFSSVLAHIPTHVDMLSLPSWQCCWFDINF